MPVTAVSRNSPTVRDLRHVNPNGLSKRKREQAISALLSLRTIQEAADEAGVGHRTLTRWLTEADFQEAYQRAQATMLQAAVNVLRHAGVTFAQVLVEVAQDKSVPAVVRVTAASRGLELLMRSHGYSDIERKLTELEADVDQIQAERLQ